jgi:protein-S-isoprenylcysteine O-methyltransferase Ste14
MSVQPATTTESARFAVPQPGTKLYDFLFGLPLIAWYAAYFSAQAPMLLSDIAAIAGGHSGAMLLLDAFSKSAALVFAAAMIGLVVIRRPATAGARGLIPKAVAFLGAFLGVAILSLPPQQIGWPLQLLSTVLVLGGMSFAAYALLWLGRSISVMSEARHLVTGGPYGIVRHPLYLGEETALIGLTLQFLSPMAIVVLAMQLCLQLYRMGYEEQVMREAFPEYADYAQRVKRLVPGLY